MCQEVFPTGECYYDGVVLFSSFLPLSVVCIIDYSALTCNLVIVVDGQVFVDIFYDDNCGDDDKENGRNFLP